MANTIQDCKVFIASPSGLDSERNTFHEAMQEFNEHNFKQRKVIFTPVGWEITLGGVGRPQKFINEDLIDCDYFILVLWDHWGSSPDKNSKFTSGCEEEFDLALKCLKGSKFPMKQVVIFFKDIEGVRLKDPGPQLSKVLKFKEEITKSKEHLYHTFNTPESFQKLLRKHLTNWSLELERNSDSISRATRNSNVQPSLSTSPATPNEYKDRSLKQLKKNIEDILDSIAGSSDGRGTNLSRFSIIRIANWAQSIYSEKVGYSEFGNHEINRVYSARKQFKLTQVEKSALLLHLTTTKNNYAPGWYFFKSTKTTELFIKILVLYFQSDDEEKKKNIQSFLREFFKEAKFDKALLDKFKKDLTEEEAIAKLNEIVSFCEKPSQPNHHALFTKTSLNSILQSAIKTADPVEQNRILQILIESKRKDSLFLKNITLAANCNKNEIKLFGIEELINRKKQLAKPNVDYLKDGEDFERKRLWIRFQILSGHIYESKEITAIVESSVNFKQEGMMGILTKEYDDIVLENYSQIPKNKLEKEIDFGNSFIAEAFYSLLAKSTQDPIKIFEGYANRSVDDWININYSGMIDEFGELGRAKLRKVFNEEHLEMVKYRLELGLIRYLCDNGNKKAYAIIIEALKAKNKNYYKYLIAKEIKKLFHLLSKSEMLTLLEIPEVDKSEVNVAIAKYHGNAETLKEILNQRESNLFKIACKEALSRKLKGVIDYLLVFLHDEKDELRKYAFASFISFNGYKKLTQLLSSYTENGTYYYDIVAWIDRLLYAPQPLKSKYKRKIEALIE